MALSLFAAEALVEDYLNGRTLPGPLHRCVVHTVETRLIDGKIPVLDANLRKEIDSKASVLRTAPGGA